MIDVDDDVDDVSDEDQLYLDEELVDLEQDFADDLQISQQQSQQQRPRPKRRQQRQHQRPASAAVGGGSLFAARDSNTPELAPAPRTSQQPSGGTSRMSVPSDAITAFQVATTLLERCLPVLNGTVYTAEAHQRAVLSPTGMESLLPLLSEAVPFSLQEQALYVMLNATSLKDASALTTACDQDAIRGVQAAANLARTSGSEDGLGVAVTVLANLAEGCARGRERFAESPEGMALLMSLLDESSSITSDEVRTPAATLLLALCSAEPSRSVVLTKGGRRALEAIAAWGARATQVLAAQAKQALREL